MNGLQVFKNDLFGEVRTVMKGGEPWFVAADLCRAMDLDDTNKAMSRLDDDEKGTNLIPTPGGQQKVTIVNEAGMYTLILGSRKPEARAFKRWVTHDVLPSIRKYGVYAAGNAPPTAEAVAALLKALHQEQARSEKLEQRLAWATSPRAKQMREHAREQRALPQPDDLPERAAETFLKAVNELIASGRARVQSLGEGAPEGDGSQPLIGYLENGRLYVLPTPSYALVSALCREQGEPFPVTQKALMRCLREAGAIVPAGNGRNSTRLKRIGGKAVRLLWMET